MSHVQHGDAPVRGVLLAGVLPHLPALSRWQQVAQLLQLSPLGVMRSDFLGAHERGSDARSGGTDAADEADTIETVRALAGPVQPESG